MKLFENGRNVSEVCESGFAKQPRVIIIMNNANNVPDVKTVGSHLLWQKLIRIAAKISFDADIKSDMKLFERIVSRFGLLGMRISTLDPDKGYKSAIFVEGSLHSYLQLSIDLSQLSEDMNAVFDQILKGISPIVNAAYTYIISHDQMNAIGPNQFDSNELFSTPVESNNPKEIIQAAIDNGVRLSIDDILSLHFMCKLKSQEYRKLFMLSSDFYAVTSDGIYVSISLLELKYINNMHPDSITDAFGIEMGVFLDDLKIVY